MIGPVVSPIISGFVSASYLTWRFCFWILLIVGVAILIPQFVWLPETFGPVLLIDKAKRLRAETGDDSFVAPAELEDRSVRRMLKLTLTRPLEMLFTEAIVAAISLYLAFVYGTFYMTFQSYPIIFQGKDKTLFNVSVFYIAPNRQLTVPQASTVSPRASQGWHSSQCASAPPSLVSP